jgi:hypothetical protein
MFPVRYELDFYIPEEVILSLHSLHRDSRENLNSYVALTGWPL